MDIICPASLPLEDNSASSDVSGTCSEISDRVPEAAATKLRTISTSAPYLNHYTTKVSENELASETSGCKHCLLANGVFVTCQGHGDCGKSCEKRRVCILLHSTDKNKGSLKQTMVYLKWGFCNPQIFTWVASANSSGVVH